MPLSDYQLEYTNGPTTILMGNIGVTVPSYDLISIEGLFGMDVRDGDRAWTRNHGDLPGEHLLTPKNIILQTEVRGDPTLTAYWDAVYLMTKAFTTRQFPSDSDMLKFKVPGLTEAFIRCRPTRRSFDRTFRTEYGLAPITVNLKAADPRIYRPVGAMNSSGAQSGTFNVTNAGSANAYPKLTFSSGSAVLTNNTFPVVMTITGASAGVVADMDRWIRGVNALIVYNGATNNYDKWIQPRVPFFLGSGVNSLTVSAGTVTVEWYDTSI